MTVSSNPRGRGGLRRVPIPEVVGLGIDDAHVVLSNAGFERVKIHYTEDYVDEFSVIDQYPRSGLLVSADTEVQLRICRFSLVQYLPQVYQQVALDGASFLKGFLYIVQSVYDSVNRRLDRINELFDPRSADPDFLPWLASWLAIALNPDWTTLQRRRMLLAATQLFPVRGTAHAIREFVRIYVGANVDIEENTWPYQGFRIGVHSTVGDDTVILPPMNLAHCFVVRLDKPASATPEDEIIKIHHIIQNQKPAHVSYFLAFSDEAECGVMGSFMAIGVPDEAAGGIGMGIGLGMDGVAFEGAEDSSDPAGGLLYTEPEPAAESAADDEDAADEADAKKQPKTTAAGKKPKTAAKGRTTKAKAAEAATTKAKSTKSTKSTTSKSRKTTKKTPKE